MQCPLRPGAYRKPEPPAFDGLAMTWMDDMAGAKLSAESPAYHLTKADEANFLDPRHTGSIITQEDVIVG